MKPEGVALTTLAPLEADRHHRARWLRPWFVLASVLLVGGCADDGPIRIGVAGAFTDPAGRPSLLAARLAVEEINANGGVDGRSFELLAANDYGNPDSAVAAATWLYDAGVRAVVGHVFSGTTLAAAPVYNGGDDPVVAISPSSSSPEVSSAGPYTFRLCPSDYAHAAALARWVRDRLRLERGSVFFLNDQYGRGVRRTFVREFVGREGEVLAVNPYLGDNPEVGPFLERLSRAGEAQFLVLAGTRADAESILYEMRRRGIDLPVVGGDGLDGIENAGPVANGVYVSAAYVSTIKTDANRRFVEAYRRKYPDAGEPNNAAAATYDAIYLLRKVIARVGTDRTEIRDAVAKIGTELPAFQGVTGRIAFDEQGDVPDRKVYITLVRNGAIQLVGQE